MANMIPYILFWATVVTFFVYIGIVFATFVEIFADED